MTRDFLWSCKCEIWGLAVFVPLWWHISKQLVAGCFRRPDR